MRKLLSRLLKQHQLGQFPGAAKSVFGRTLVYVGYANFCMIAAMAYETFSEPLLQYIPWLTFRMFLAVLVGGLLVVMVLDYKFMLPSEWNFLLKQQWRHVNPTRAEFKKIRDKLEATEKKNGKAQAKIWKKLDNIEKKIDKGGANGRDK